MICNKEFTIKQRPKDKFRVGKISPIELLALQTQFNFENMTQSQTVMTFILEHTEVEICGQWFKVKEVGKESYLPDNISDDLFALQEIITYFLNEVFKPAFMKSGE